MWSDSGAWSHANQSFCPCDYAFIVEKGNYTFRASDLLNSSKTSPLEEDSAMPLLLDSTMPLLLDWAMSMMSTPAAAPSACASTQPMALDTSATVPKATKAIPTSSTDVYIYVCDMIVYDD
jgi:hypothetical protein